MLTIRQIRDKIAAGILAALGLAGWRESRLAFDVFPADTDQIAHLAFAVGIPNTVTSSTDRQSTHGGAVPRYTLATTQASVRFLSRLRADAQVLDYAAALDHEAALVAAVVALDSDPDLTIRYRSTPTRSGAAGDGTAFVAQVDFEVLHYLPLE